MTNHLATGTLGDLIKAMPPQLRRQLDDEIAQFDQELLSAQQEGKPKEPLLYNQLRWVRHAQPQHRLGRLSMDLGHLLKRYFPLTDEMVHANRLPSLSDCSFFWGLQIKRLEKESTQTPVAA